MPIKSRVLPALHGKDLDQALSQEGWRRVQEPPELAEADVESVWRHESADAFVAWIDDREVAEHYYGLVFGAGVEAALQSLYATGAMIDARTGIKTIQHADTVAELGSAARALGLLAVGPFDREVYKVLSGLLALDNVDLQFEALTGISLSAWPQFEQDLEAIIRKPGADPAVREDAQSIAQEQAESHWNEEFR